MTKTSTLIIGLSLLSSSIAVYASYPCVQTGTGPFPYKYCCWVAFMAQEFTCFSANDTKGFSKYTLPYDYYDPYNDYLLAKKPKLSPSTNYSITCKHRPQDKRLVCKPYGDYKHVITNKVKSEGEWAGWSMQDGAAIQVFTPLN